MVQQPPAAQQVFGDLPPAYLQQPLPGSPAGAPGGWGPPPEPSRRSGVVVPLLVVAALVLVAVTGGALLWLRSQRAGDATATPISATTAAGIPSGASPSPSVPPASPASLAGGTTGSAAGDVGPTTTVASPSGATGTPLSAAAFARTVDGLLDESSAARGTVASTATALQSCRTSATHAAAVFSAAGAARSSLATRAGVVDGAATPGGADAVAAFVAMQQASARADGALADWAHDVSAAGCRSTAPHTANWALANQYSADATAAKARFVAVWNPIAAANGFSPRGTDGI
jgi:hypothetical protein